MSIAKSTSFVRSKLSFTGRVLRQQVWLWPVIAAVILVVVGWSIRSLVERAIKTTMAENLQTILVADAAAIELWLEMQKNNAEAAASDRLIADLINRLAGLAGEESVTDEILRSSGNQKALRSELRPFLEAHDYTGYVIVNARGQVIAAKRDEIIGKDNLPIPEGLLEEIQRGNVVVTPPFRSAMLLEDEEGNLQSGLPTMFAVAPIRDDSRQVVAALGLRIRPEKHFTYLLSIARAGETGETYAFSGEGLLLSQSRFDNELKDIGLLPDREDEKSILNLHIRDPQVNMMRGQRPALHRQEQPLTRMAADAVQGGAGVDVEGYRDYRGVPVIGAWMWLQEYDFGIATEVDVAEAYRPLYILRRVFWGLFALLAASAVAIFVYSVVVARLHEKARKAALEAKELGQYTLDEQIGAGGMGVVYRGHHAMLRRPTAVKLLDPEKTTDAAIARFEREVQMTAQLNHPNTIAIYDYGRTPEGVFYYAMELLEGIDLEELVKEHGPQPEGRVIHLLRQVCASLAEAHGIGLIHRDIKPANMFTGVRGGVYDFVKLLDFGLVKAVDAKKQATITAAGSFAGTPMYLSPEGIETPDKTDARSDLYAVGAVGYYLLTGQPLFEATSVVEVCMHQVNTMPQPPSQRLGREVDAVLENVLMRCLAKRPQQRPVTARVLQAELANCPSANTWTDADAEKWWRKHFPQLCPESPDETLADTGRLANTLVVDRPDST